MIYLESYTTYESMQKYIDMKNTGHKRILIILIVTWCMHLNSTLKKINLLSYSIKDLIKLFSFLYRKVWNVYQCKHIFIDIPKVLLHMTTHHKNVQICL